MSSTPVIGLVGSQGAYGRWLRQFFEQRMQLPVIGFDPVDPASESLDHVLDAADVLLFTAPIRHTVSIIDDCVARSAGRERGRLWLDITSIKQAPVAAMCRSQADVVGLHPMTAPPKSPTLKGRVLVVCEARLDHWRDWLAKLLAALEAEVVRIDAEHHDRAMTLVQAMVHATHLAQAAVVRSHATSLGPPSSLLPMRTAAFEMDHAIVTRILSLNPQIYEDIQFDNPHVPEMLDRLADELTTLRDLVRSGGEAARKAFRTRFLHDSHDAYGTEVLGEGNHAFERIAYLLADLLETPSLALHLPDDRSGSLRALLEVFERHGVSLSSIHSSRTPAGEVHFRFGFAADQDRAALDAVVRDIEASAIGRMID
ncbi:prephenate dehydrogenase [Lysobacter brunescens]|uniref:Prephenate dehydrogenase n=1 Tax=Lysobacter brunescens TaxID=262323 RepID=A0ABW2YG64_9GAMM